MATKKELQSFANYIIEKLEEAGNDNGLGKFVCEEIAANAKRLTIN